MKRLFVALATVGLLAGIVASPVAAAPGGVQRNQVTTNVYELQIGYHHTFTIVFSCGGSLSASGWQWGANGDPNVHNPDETITATLSSDGTYINISSVYVGGWGGSPYAWTGGFPVAGGTGTATESQGAHTTYTFPVILVTTSATTWANHGAYVTASGGGDDAAHSCIGMPIVAGP